MKTRILSWLLVFVMCASLLSACDANAGQTSDEPNSPTQSETVSPEGPTAGQQEEPDATVEPSDDPDSTQSESGITDVSQSGGEVSETDPPLVKEPEGSSQTPEQAPDTIVVVSGFSLSSVEAYTGKA